MTPEHQKQIESAAHAAARLQFHPQYMADAYTACVICYRKGANSSAEKLEQLEAEVARLKQILYELFAADFFGRSEEFEAAWVLYKTKNNIQ